MKNQGGFSLVELMTVITIMSIGTGIFAKSLLSKAQKRADVDAVKSMLTQASNQSLVRAKHFGIHFNLELKTAGIFEDLDKDNIFNGSDTVISYVRYNPNADLAVADADDVPTLDICFKKNGAVSSDNSYELTYVAATGDTAKLQIIAASGRVMGP
jgi:prepilin-type N-terminal cleavage/methylation domain-containing protein